MKASNQREKNIMKQKHQSQDTNVTEVKTTPEQVNNHGMRQRYHKKRKHKARRKIMSSEKEAATQSKTEEMYINLEDENETSKSTLQQEHQP